MRLRFILSETWTSLRRNVPMILSVMLVTFISFLFIGASVLMQAQITKAKGDWYDKVEVVVWLCPDGASQSANCSDTVPPVVVPIFSFLDSASSSSTVVAFMLQINAPSAALEIAARSIDLRLSGVMLMIF